jgi:predicted amidohydrolase YtcJ
MLADLVVVDRNPYDIDIAEVHEIKVLTSIVRGELVYSSGQ